MKSQTTKTSQYRHRGFKCVDCGVIKEIFGEITTLPGCCGELLPMWDHLVNEVSTVAQYQKPDSDPQSGN